MKKILLLLLLLSRLYGDDLTYDPPLPWQSSCELPCCPQADCLESELIVDLNQPIYEGGILSTETGGVLRSKGLFVQARNLKFDRREGEGVLFCSGDLLVEYHGQVMVGQEFFYDLSKRSGYLTCVSTAYFPWQLGASKVLLLENGSLEFIEGFLTSSEGKEHELALTAKKMVIDCERRLTTSSVRVRLYDQPILFLPAFHLDLSQLKRPPLDVKVGWGGYLGPHLSIRYHAFSYKDLKASLRLDGYLTHGAGVGVETSFHPACTPLAIYTRNYWAHDLAIDDPTKRNRYRLQGSYVNQFFDYRTTVAARYDYVSDAQMAADYNHESFRLNPAQETRFQLRHQENFMLANLIVDVRLNSFQTVDQQLPTFALHLHPLRLPYTDCIFENSLKLSNINFITSSELTNKTQQQAARLEVRPQLYWPLHFSALTLTPRAGLIAIGYSDSPENQTQNQILGHFSAEATTALSNRYSWGHHLLIPHARLTHLTTPTSAFHEHFIFTIDDAYTRFDELRFGLKQLFSFPFSCQPLILDLWSNAFFDPKNGIHTLPKSYLDADWQILPSLFGHVGIGMHYGKSTLDYLNTRVEWALSQHASLSIEYRNRGDYAWRKADHYNFILDTARNQEALLDSPLSDRRNTLLATLFYRVNPDWTLKFSSRYGKHATQDSSYFEYELESRAAILDRWWLHFSYQHRESDSRFAFSLKLAR